MPGYLYFVEGRTTESISHDELAAWGLGYILDGGSTAAKGAKPVGCRCMKGPGGVSGVTFAMRSRQADQNILYQESEQEWRPMEMAGGESAQSAVGSGQDNATAGKGPAAKLWVGWWKHSPPTPADLERRETLKGEKVKLADGNEWLVPVLREWPDMAPEGEDPRYRCALPQMVRRIKEGWVLGDVLTKYQTLWDHHCEACGSLFYPTADGAIAMDYSQLYDHCVELLAVNYVVSFDELSALGVFDTDSMPDVIEASSEYAKYAAWLQKKITDLSPDESDGGAA